MKIIFSGLGADEIFGGYMRYWVAFHRMGAFSLKEEMNFGYFLKLYNLINFLYFY